MTIDHLQLDSLNEQNLRVMQAYAARAAAGKVSDSEEFDGWLERVDALEDLTSDELTRVHGELIAMGFLKFEISGRNIGLRYQISTRGRQALEKSMARSEEEASAEDALADAA